MKKFKIHYTYECSFKSDKGTRHILVCTDNFGRAAHLANLVRSGWDDSDSFELFFVHLKDAVVVNN